MSAGERLGNRATSLVAQVAVFVALGVALVSVGATRTPRSRAFFETPRFTVWAALIVAQVASWPILFRYGRDKLRRLRAYELPDRRRSEAMRLCALGLAVFVFWLLSQFREDRPDVGLWGHGVRVGVALLGGFVAVAPCIVAMWRTHDALAPAVSDPASAVAMFHRLNPLRAVFTGTLTAVGVLVTEATLAAGALRSALIQARPGTADDFPAEFVLLYGGFFTALLAAAAAPTYGRFTRRTAAVVDTLLPVVPPTEQGWRERLAERRELAAFVHADTSLLQGIKATVLVAGPLLTGLVSSLIPTR